MKTLSFKKKAIIFFVLFFFCFCLFVLNIKNNVQTFQPISNTVIVIDAGHGGIDGGCTGKKTGVCESDLNLTYAKNLYSQLSSMGYKCFFTRKDKNGLYDNNAKNLKKSDMQKRKEIIDKVPEALAVVI